MRWRGELVSICVLLARYGFATGRVASMAKHERNACGTCNGSGQISQSEVEIRGGKPTGKMVQRQIRCPQCGGTGLR